MISIIIPLYNKASHIERAVRSVFAQSYQEFELIIVNDGSTDLGPAIIRTIQDPRVTIIDQDNAGVSAARNRGISTAKGELVAFLDADDLWNGDFLATIVRLNRIYPWAGLYATDYQIQRSEDRKINNRIKALPSGHREGVIPQYFRSAALGAPPVWTSACCVPRHVLGQVGGFAEGRRMGEDLDLWGRIALLHTIAYSAYQGAVYCQNAENRSCLSFSKEDEHPFLQTIEKLKRSGGIPEIHARDIELYATRLTIENIRQHVLAGNTERARELSRELKNRWAFPLRQFMWGSRLNVVTRSIWYLRNSQLL